EQEKLLHAAMSAWMNDFAPQGILVTDVDLRVRVWNKWLEINTHRTADEVRGKHLSEIFPRFEVRGLNRYYENALKGQASVLSHTFHTHFLPIELPGKNRFMHQSGYIASLTSGEQVIGTLTLIEDVTERVSREVELQKRADDVARLLTSEQQSHALLNEANLRLEERVRQRTHELTEVNTALESFTYTVSHDLRAPIRNILGFAQAIDEDYGETLDEAAKESIQLIVNSAKNMESLIQALLNYSKLSRVELALGPVSIQDALEAAKEQLNAQIRETHALIEATPDLPRVTAHQQTLIQILSNLISNAIKFVDQSHSPQVRIFAERIGRFVRLWVEDNGIGIQKQDEQRIFEVFERLHGPDSYGGTGIGLALVRKGVERMGGNCGVVSDVGVGSRFWLELPAAN
ncbi:MAG TPA: ATP-binding protein, partial [Candidatus Saccharimonadales bacterium]|nr:ATP-binding protein [Candidatus Saccharimonadales bacterium]